MSRRKTDREISVTVTDAELPEHAPLQATFEPGLAFNVICVPWTNNAEKDRCLGAIDSVTRTDATLPLP